MTSGSVFTFSLLLGSNGDTVHASTVQLLGSFAPTQDLRAPRQELLLPSRKSVIPPEVPMIVDKPELLCRYSKDCPPNLCGPGARMLFAECDPSQQAYSKGVKTSSSLFTQRVTSTSSLWTTLRSDEPCIHWYIGHFVFEFDSPGSEDLNIGEVVVSCGYAETCTHWFCPCRELCWCLSLISSTALRSGYSWGYAETSAYCATCAEHRPEVWMLFIGQVADSSVVAQRQIWSFQLQRDTGFRSSPDGPLCECASQTVGQSDDSCIWLPRASVPLESLMAWTPLKSGRTIGSNELKGTEPRTEP